MENYLAVNLKFIREQKGLNQTEFGNIIGKKKSIVGPYEKGEVEPDISTLINISDFFGISISDLIGKNLSGSEILSQKSNDLPVVKSVEKSYIVDSTGMRFIPITDIKAAAGQGYINNDNIDLNEIIQLPKAMIKSGNHLCIRIKGASMAPTLLDSGYVIIRLLERSEWMNMPSERIYVIVNNDGMTFLKRVKNRLNSERGFIVLMSDSPDKMSHPNFNLMVDEIASIWYVEWYFTAKMPNIHDQYYSKLSSLEDTVQDLSQQFIDLKKRL